MGLQRKDLKAFLLEFLRKHGKEGQGVLVAVSGGPDSLALLHLLLTCSEEFPLRIHVAHVDHRWREESRKEAAKLKTLVRSWGLPFHLKVLTPSSSLNSQENICREQRYAFFEELAFSHQCYTLCLGHQRDDVSETVLKRACEGASFIRLASMEEVGERSSLQLWRPLLKFPKADLEAYCEVHSLPAFQDASNTDPRYLRGRLRQTLLPFCSQQLGKEVEAPLATLAEEARQLSAYLDERCKKYWCQLLRGGWGLCLDLSTDSPSHPYELQHLLRRLCETTDFVLSRLQGETLCHQLIERHTNRRLERGEQSLYVDRGRVFIKRELQREGEKGVLPLRLGIYEWGAWRVEVRKERAWPPLSGWQAVWKGKCRITLPEHLSLEEFSLGLAERSLPYGGKRSLDRWWTEQGVPAFMRDVVPVLYYKDEVYHEFLGRALAEKNPSSSVSDQYVLLFSLKARMLP